ncbi:MAG: helix-turn-helix transcriptional regulator [Chryseolinea sp.]
MDLTPKLDLFSIFIFLGIIQGIFLLGFFLTGDNLKIKSNVFHGLMLFSIVACLVEIFLQYSGYIIHCLYLVDFSEAFGLAIGPCFYLLVVSQTGKKITWKHYLHLAFPVVYFFLQMPFLILPEDAKYNAWIYSYHPDWPYRTYHNTYDPRFFWVTDHCTEVSITSLSIYFLLAGREIFLSFRRKGESFFKTSNGALQFLRWEILQMLFATVGIVFVKIFHEHDTGDHLFATYIAVTIYLTNFRIIKDSGFFRRPSLAEVQKYKTSGVTTETQDIILNNLVELMNSKKPFLQPDFSLPSLAKQLNTSVHALSQVINERTGRSFFEMTAEYRVKEAQLILKTSPHFKIEEIAEQVGYNSKSAFNTSFKKYTGKTPSEFRSGGGR